MNKNNLEYVVDQLLTLFPLFRKKLFRPNLNLEHTDLTPSHFHVIVMLNEAKRLTMSDISKRLSISKPNVTTLIDHLIIKQMVTRIRSHEDRRVVYIVLTEEGKLFFDQYKKLLAAELKQKLTIFDEDDLKELWNALEVVNQMISKIDSE
ncbi:transcriptional regulator, MarR family [Alkaliphilus metalliredigens QYMF]|uniref:Transcriptional regulator, MarR family n=1 Tax=Alkaliphilus metalliredigens (strain QYMF) TaxID=293826 RepID=A6TMA3_ALKMQ|nr:MarR family transcriptional regulator [Alkaliphilus metalliredigens]ABR47321.1 transcriptional regulator, MarR family [Alkaliphilus metalliredigens QYMF]